MQRKSTPLPAEVLQQPHLCEIEHVRHVYDSIAQTWNATRYQPWPRVAEFIRRQPRGALFADVGCGNGKNRDVCAERGFVVGSDFSLGLLQICQQKQHEVCAADALRLPFRTESVDVVLSIAVIHHISTEDRRAQLIAEMLRILRPGGQALIYAWALEQGEEGRSGHAFAAQDVWVPWHVRQGEPASILRLSPASHGLMDLEKRAVVFQRYCHVHREGELPLLLQRALARHPHIRVKMVEHYTDHGNWAMCVEREGASLPSPALLQDGPAPGSESESPGDR